MMMILFSLSAPTRDLRRVAQIQDLHLSDLVKCANLGGGGADACTTIWSPSVVTTKSNVTLAVAQAQWKNGRDVVKAIPEYRLASKQSRPVLS